MSAYTAGVRRKAGTLVPLEESICTAALVLQQRGSVQFHGYELAKQIGEDADRKLLTAYGTLYRALARLEKMKLVTSKWEDPRVAARENRPPRRLYTLTALGAAAAREAARANLAEASARRRRLVPA